MGDPAAHDCLEADQLKLSKEKFPLTISLQELVMQRFADNGGGQVQQPMDWEELLAYIRAIEDVDQDPLAAILAQTEVIGDPALPKPGERAALRWVGAAFDAWEQGFPLEVELLTHLRALKPVLARAALSEAAFFKPGQHPLHQLLDALHENAIGWQPDLGRAGEPVKALLDSTVEDARAWLDGGGVRLQDLATNTVETTRRAKARADRMALRAVEAERGKVRAAQARVTAAQMINGAMEQSPVPADIGSMLKGPWYDSAQLVLLKFGEESDEWQQMSEATLSLASSLQPLAEGDEAQKRELLNKIAKVPTELKRWLLSLQHDGDTLEQILTTVEYAQLRLMRGQPAEGGAATPIQVDGGMDGSGAASLSAFTQGQWFMIAQRSGKPVRAQLAMAQGGQLLFCNMAGLKVMALGQDKFTDMLEDGSISPIPSGASFSRALALAAGIDSDETLAPLIGEPEPETTAAPEAQAEAGAQAEQAAALVTDDPVQLEPDPVSEPVLPDSGQPELPMGTWLGFHDVDPPLLAKLALHDKVRKLLIFVNRKGMELRRLEEDDYFNLIKEGQVDIMEARNNFREQVERARARLQRHQS